MSLFELANATPAVYSNSRTQGYFEDEYKMLRGQGYDAQTAQRLAQQTVQSHADVYDTSPALNPIQNHSVNAAFDAAMSPEILANNPDNPKGQPAVVPGMNTTGATWSGAQPLNVPQTAINNGLQNPGNADPRNLPQAVKEQMVRDAIASIPGRTRAPSTQEVAIVLGALAAGRIASLAAPEIMGLVGGAGAAGAAGAAGSTAASGLGGAAAGALGNAAAGAVGGAAAQAASDWWTNPAILAALSSGLGITGSLSAANAQAQAAEKASALQADAARNSLEEQRRQFNELKAREEAIYNQQRTDTQPYREAGTQALGQVQAFDQNNPNFGMAQFQRDPGYNFRFSEGMKALQNSAAARGGLLSGNFMKGAQEYGQNMASQEYQNAFNRYQTERGAKLNRLQSLAGVGQSAVQQAGQAGQNYANATGQAGQNYANGASASYTSGANAQAGGITGAANANSLGMIGATNAGVNSLNALMNNYYSQQYLNKLGG